MSFVNLDNRGRKLAMKKGSAQTVKKMGTLVTKKIRRSLLSHLGMLKTRHRSGTNVVKKIATRYLKPF